MNIIKTNLTVLSRQDSVTHLRSRLEETCRDPHGNVVRFSVLLHNNSRNLGVPYARADHFVDGHWLPIVQMFRENLPKETGDALMWLLAAVGAILDWPDTPKMPSEEE